MVCHSTLIANKCIVDTAVHLEKPFAFLAKKRFGFFSDIYPSISPVLILGQILNNLGQL